MYRRKSLTLAIVCALLLSSCVTVPFGSSGRGSGQGGGPSVGPATSSLLAKLQQADVELPVAQRPRLDVIVPIFDPGLPDNLNNATEQGIWPELRRAEANRFAVKMKKAIEATEAFGAVRVMPDATASGDVFVLGTIEESNGETVAIKVTAVDVGGNQWFSKSFSYDVPEEFYNDIRSDNQDPYDPVFEDAAKRLVEELDGQSDQELNRLQALTTVRFGANFSEDAFAPYMNVDGGTVELTGYPSKQDPMLRRVEAIRVRDQLFVDRIQQNYEQFSQQMETSYAVWQKQSAMEIAAERQAKYDTAGQAVAGVALIALSVMAAIAGSKSDSYGGQTAGATGATLGAMAGAHFISKAFQTNEETKVHADALAELGKSMDVEMGPQVVEFEKTTAELSGTAKEQFAQWRAFLQQIFAQETTPDVVL